MNPLGSGESVTGIRSKKVAVSGNGGPMDYKAAAHFLVLGARTVQLCSVVMKYGAAIVDELHKLRDKVAAIDFSKIPGPALSGLHAGAQLLRGLDVAGAVNPPLNEALAADLPRAGQASFTRQQEPLA